METKNDRGSEFVPTHKSMNHVKDLLIFLISIYLQYKYLPWSLTDSMLTLNFLYEFSYRTSALFARYDSSRQPILQGVTECIFLIRLLNLFGDENVFAQVAFLVVSKLPRFK